MNIGALYTKGVNLATVQNDNRNIIQNLTTSVQYSGVQMSGPSTASYNYGGVNIPVQAICFGDIRFSYILGFYSIPHVLWKDIMTGQGSCEPLNIGLSSPVCGGPVGCLGSVPGSGSELVGPHMHLASLTVGALHFTNNLYSIEVGLAYGSKDLFKQSSGNYVMNNGNYICNNTTGQQFCATSTLSTVAMERVNQ